MRKLKIVKRVEDYITSYMETDSFLNKSETIIFFILLFLVEFGVVVLSALIPHLPWVVGFYVVISFILSVFIIDRLDDIEPNILYGFYVFLVPHLFLIVGVDKFINLFIPYRGKDILILRRYKLKMIKRRIRINKLKFWRRM